MRPDDRDSVGGHAVLSAARLQFLGHEFLTWLYFQTQANSEVKLDGDEVAHIVIGKKINLKPLGSGDLRVAVGGSRLDDSGEVLQAIRSGALVDSLALQIGLSNRVHELTLPADGSLSQVKTRYLFNESDSEAPSFEEGDEKPSKSLQEEERILIRMSALDEVETIVDNLFKQFLERRLSQGFISREVAQMRVNVAEGLKAKLPISRIPSPDFTEAKSPSPAAAGEGF